MITSSPISGCAGQFSLSLVTHLACRSVPTTANTPGSIPPTLYPSEIKRTEVNWVIGMALGAFCYGILLNLGLNCLNALRHLPPQAGFWNQRRLLMVHVSLLVVLNAVFQINSMRENIIAIFYTRPEASTYFYLNKWNLLLVATFALTDGLLVWRCYMVQRSLLLGRKVLWQHLCWISPLALWFMLVSIGMASVILGDPNIPLSEPIPSFSMSLLFACVVGNILLNLIATCYIIIRLLIHRRLMIASFGSSSSIPKLHLRIINILLESAIINLPVAIISMVCATLEGGWGHLFWQVSVPAQSASSVLVIYQIAKGRAVGSESMNTKETMAPHLDTLGENL